MYAAALRDRYAGSAELVGLCDPNPARMAFQCKDLGISPVCFEPAEFTDKAAELAADVVIVTSMDRTHDRYIIEALESGKNVITEKPMTTDEQKCRSILRAKERSGGDLTVTFNYRYSPRNSAVKQALSDGAIGDVHSVHFEWLLDTRHGADYFRRWHRDKRNSGGLMVHKASHHFDLVNWWLGARPESAFGFGDLTFYGRANADQRGVPPRRYRSKDNLRDGPGDRWDIDISSDALMVGLYQDPEPHDGYLRDRDVFSDGISIEDDMSVLVRYETGATMTYHLTAYSPWEGYRVMFNGSEGRLELEVVERAHLADTADIDPSALEKAPTHHRTSLTVQRHWGLPETIPIEEGNGGHGGGDTRLLDDLFGAEPPTDPLGRAAGHMDGAYAMLIGAAANRSFATGQPIRIADLM